jgi:hypothetical protein
MAQALDENEKSHLPAGKNIWIHVDECDAFDKLEPGGTCVKAVCDIFG